MSVAVLCDLLDYCVVNDELLLDQHITVPDIQPFCPVLRKEMFCYYKTRVAVLKESG